MPQLTVRGNVRALGALVRKYGEETIKSLIAMLQQQAADATEDLREEGTPTQEGEGLEWSTDRQYTAWRLSGGFGQGIPYVRRHTRRLGWKVIPTTFGARVENNSPGVVYLYGDARGERQEPMYTYRWPRFRDVIELAMIRLPSEVTETLRKLWKRLPKEVE